MNGIQNNRNEYVFIAILLLVGVLKDPTESKTFSVDFILKLGT